MKGFFKFLTKQKKPEKQPARKVDQVTIVPPQPMRPAQRPKQESSPSGGIELPPDFIEEFGITLEEFDKETGQIDPDEDERRKFQRLNRSSLIDQEITIYSNNLNTSANSRDQLLDLSAGGLLLASKSPKEINDIHMLEFRLGTMQFKLQGRVMRKKDPFYGLEFVNPSEETIDSIEQLYGSARLNKPRRGTR